MLFHTYFTLCTRSSSSFPFALPQKQVIKRNVLATSPQPKWLGQSYPECTAKIVTASLPWLRRRDGVRITISQSAHTCDCCTVQLTCVGALIFPGNAYRSKAINAINCGCIAALPLTWSDTCRLQPLHVSIRMSNNIFEFPITSGHSSLRTLCKCHKTALPLCTLQMTCFWTAISLASICTLRKTKPTKPPDRAHLAEDISKTLSDIIS